jgi:hypothetical protein
LGGAGQPCRSRCVLLGAKADEHGDVIEVLATLGLGPIAEPRGRRLHPDQILGVGDQNACAQNLDGDRSLSQLLVRPR